MLRAVYLSSVLLVSLAGAAGPALAQSFLPPHPIPPVDIGAEDIPSYATPPVYSQALPPPPQEPTYGASPAGPESYPPAAVVVPSSGATPPIYSQPTPPPPQEPTYGAPSQHG